MAKPETRPVAVSEILPPRPQPGPTPSVYPDARRVRVERSGNNSYMVVEDVYSGAPKRSKVLMRNATKAEAEYEVRLWLENFLGPNRFGDSGL